MAEITWVKLKTDMFDNEKIKLIESLPESDSILIIWIKLIAYAGKINSGGYIMLTENIPMNIEELATIFGRPLNTVRLALNTFERYGMIIKSENGAIKIKNWENHQNIDGMERIKLQNRERKRRQREREKQKKLSQNNCHVTVTQSHATDIEVEEDKEEDIDKEIDKEVEEDKELKTFNAYDFYQKNGFGVLNGHIREEMEIYLQSFANDSDEIIIAAMKIAIDRNCFSWGYIKGILKSWINAKLNSIDEVRAYEKNKLKKLQTKNLRNNQYNSIESTPEWLLNQKSSNENSYTENNSADFEQRKKDLEEEMKNFWKEDDK